MTTAATPAPSAPSAPFRAGLFEVPPEGPPRLIASTCATCGRSYFPARDGCPHCGDAGRMAECRLSGAGTIHASTIVRVPSPVGIKSPYAYGYVDLDAARLRVFALFTTVTPAALLPGTRVELVVEPLRQDAQGNLLLAHKFRPVAEGDR